MQILINSVSVYVAPYLMFPFSEYCLFEFRISLFEIRIEMFVYDSMIGCDQVG